MTDVTLAARFAAAREGWFGSASKALAPVRVLLLNPSGEEELGALQTPLDGCGAQVRPIPNSSVRR